VGGQQMIKVIRICNICGKEFEQDIDNTPARIDNVVVYPVNFLCNDCILIRGREILKSIDAIQLTMDLAQARKEMD